MQLEAVKPIHAGFSALVVKGNPVCGTQAADQIYTQRYQRGRDAFEEACIARQLRELPTPMRTYLVQVEMFEAAIVGIVKGNHQGEHLAQRQATRPRPVLPRCRQQPGLPAWLEPTTKIIQIAKQSYNVH